MMKVLINNKKICVLFAIEIAIVILLSIGLFKKAENVYSVGGSALCELTEFRGEEFSFGIGVYDITITDADANSVLLVDLEVPQSRVKKALGNCVVFYPGQKMEDFSYVSLWNNTAHIIITSSNYTTIGQLNITVTKSNKIFRMLIFLSVVWFTLLDMIVILICGIRSGKIEKSTAIVISGLISGIIVASVPCFTDSIFWGADTPFHLLRIHQLSETLGNINSFPIRIEAGWMYGHGYANSLFYSDFFILPFALIETMGFTLAFVYKAYIIAAIIGLTISSFICIRICTKNNVAALCGSLFYLFSPYTLYNIYSRAAVGEYTAMIFIPIVLLGLYKLYSEKDNKNAWIIITIGISCILECHLISTLLISAFIAVVVLIEYKKTFLEGKIIQIILAACMTLVLNAAFFIPMIYMMINGQFSYQHTLSGGIQEHGISMLKLFQNIPFMGWSHKAVYGGEPDILSGVYLLTAIVFLIIYNKRNNENSIKLTKKLIYISFVGLILSTNFFPWNILQKIPIVGRLIGTIQFPYRILSIVTCVAAAAFACIATEFTKVKKMTRIPLWATMIVISLGMFYLSDVCANKSPVYLYSAENLGTISVGNGEYLLPGGFDWDYAYHNPVVSEGLIWSGYEKKGNSINITIYNTSDSEGVLEVPMTSYLGYEVSGSGESAEKLYISDEYGSHGDIRVIVPPRYVGEVSVYYKESKLFVMSNIISIIGILILIGLVVKITVENHKRLKCC